MNSFASTSGPRDVELGLEYPDKDLDDGYEKIGDDIFYSVKDFGDSENAGEENDGIVVDDIVRDANEADKIEEDIEQSILEDNVVVSTNTNSSQIFSDAPNTVSLRKMRSNVFFTFPDWRRRVGAYYMLIFLAAVIATSGVAADSAATVIGAMIVAPLMTPILGIVLSVVTRDCKNLFVSIWLVISGALIAITVGLVYGYFLEENSILKENNSQIAARTLPRLTDLVAALATGAVGSIAMVREDISSTLPGVSIAISLVPPLNVVGLTLSTGSWDDSAGAMILFLTNVSSILFVGSCTLLSYKVNLAANNIRGCLHRTFACSVSGCVVFFMFLLLLAVAAPLAATSWFIRYSQDLATCVESELTPMLDPLDLKVTQVEVIPSFKELGFFAEVFVASSQNQDVVVVPLPGSDILDICDIKQLTMTHIPVQTYVVSKL